MKLNSQLIQSNPILNPILNDEHCKNSIKKMTQKMSRVNMG